VLIGVYVGSSEITAALVDGVKVRAAVAEPAADSLTGGLRDILHRLTASEPAARAARAVSVSTSRFEDAVVRADGLARTACVRLSAFERDTVPPLAGWPMALRDAVGDRVYICRGGHDFDGTQPEPIDPAELAAVADQLAAGNLETVALTAVFSPVNPRAEIEAADLLRERIPTAAVSMSHEIGMIGLLERENATILNAALLPLAQRFADALSAEIGAWNPDTPVFLAQSDGTVTELSYATRYPILTFGAGSASAMRGASILSGRPDCVAVNLEFETAELGLARAESAYQVRRTSTIGGVRTNLPGAETIRISVRASAVALDGAAASDDGDGLARAIAAIDPDGVLPVVLVGSGARAASLPAGALRPIMGEVARAVGTAGTRIGVAVDCVVARQPLAQARSLERATTLALERAIMAGAAPPTVRIAEISEAPLAYLPGDFVHVRVKATGDIG
jgi:hypothetical protein